MRKCLEIHKTSWFIYLIITAGLFLRLLSLNQSFWLDETTSGWIARDFTFQEILTKFSPADFHPPLYYFFLKIWGSIVGFGEVELRLFSVACSIATIWIVFLVTKKRFDIKVATLTAAFLASSPFFLYYSQETRMYMLETLLIAASFYLFNLLLDKENMVRWSLFSAVLVLVGLTDYLPLLAVPGFFIVALVFNKSRIFYSKLLFSLIPLIVSYLLWLPIFISQLLTGFSVRSQVVYWWNLLGKTNVKNVLLVPVKFIFGRINFEPTLEYFLLSTLATVVFLPVILKSVSKKSTLFWIWLLIPLGTSFLIGYFVSVFSYFRFLFVFPALSVLISYGALNLKKFSKIAVFAIITFNLIFSFYYLMNPTLHRENWRDAIIYIKNTGKEDLVIFPAMSQFEAFRYYNQGRGVGVGGPESIGKGNNVIWLMRYTHDVFDPNDSTKIMIESSGYQKVEEKSFNGVVVWKYLAR